jgi:signal transduction histidine kinase/ActR/RegA family two-component response regulator
MLDSFRHDPAFSLMTLHLMSRVLSHADKPGDLGEYLTEEIQELIGARCVLIIQHPHVCPGDLHRIVAVKPARRRDWAQSPAAQQLYSQICGLSAPQVWHADDPSGTADLLRSEGFSASLAIPLSVGTFRVGSLLVLGMLLDETHLEAEIRLLTALSTLVALVLRNAFLYQEQERIILERTVDLKKANERLRHELDERIRLEEHLTQARKMESIGRLAGGVAHDFNNILAVILGHGELMLEDLPEGSPLRADLINMLKAGERARDLTHQLLAFGRKQILNVRMLDLNPAVQEVGGMIQRLLGEDIEIRLSLGANTGFVKADQSQLHQVLMNLCLNARDAMPSGGVLTIETRRVQIDEDFTAEHSNLAPGSYVVLQVQDTGTGMDENTLQHVFDPFFTTKEMGKGTGLGLATVYGIVKQHGGEILVSSVPGQGTMFQVYLPSVSETPSGSGTSSADGPLMGQGETVLVAEDNPHVRKLAVMMLKRLGYRVLESESVSECLEMASTASQLDLLLTDIVMPGMNGLQLSERIRASRPEVRTLFMSGYTDDVLGHHGVLQKNVHFLTKPFTEKSLSRKVQEALRGKSESIEA